MGGKEGVGLVVVLGVMIITGADVGAEVG